MDFSGFPDITSHDCLSCLSANPSAYSNRCHVVDKATRTLTAIYEFPRYAGKEWKYPLGQKPV